MNTKPNDPAFAAKGYDQGEKSLYGPDGLTKRELFAAMVLQGFIASAKHTGTWVDVCADSIGIADALINELNETPFRGKGAV